MYFCNRSFISLSIHLVHANRSKIGNKCGCKPDKKCKRKPKLFYLIYTTNYHNIAKHKRNTVLHTTNAQHNHEQKRTNNNNYEQLLPFERTTNKLFFQFERKKMAIRKSSYGSYDKSSYKKSSYGEKQLREKQLREKQLRGSYAIQKSSYAVQKSSYNSQFNEIF